MISAKTNWNISFDGTISSSKPKSVDIVCRNATEDHRKAEITSPTGPPGPLDRHIGEETISQLHVLKWQNSGIHHALKVEVLVENSAPRNHS